MSPIIFVIFGATGDLAHRKLMPAIFSLASKNKISSDSMVIGVGRRNISDEEFRESVQGKEFIPSMRYIQGLFEDPKLYQKLGETLDTYDKKVNACIPRFFYFATPPEHYQTILQHLKSSTLSEGCGQKTSNYTKILIEKPFGKDMETAQNLDTVLASACEERQIYRIDHYLAKDTVQNILAFRFANGIFEPTWNSDFIDHVQISVSENIGIETRGNIYDGIGALRDVMQNHIMQMLSLVAMEQPRAFDATSIRDERARVISSLAPIDKKTLPSIVRGQYNGYRKEHSVAPESTTETFVAMKIMVNMPRWRHVPFYLRTGKKLKEKSTEISIHYKRPALCYDDVCLFDPDKVFRNVLRIRIHPDEEISLRLMVKKPGFGMELAPVNMTYTYAQTFSEENTPGAYEKLLMDAISGDQTLFARTDEIQASWKFFSPVLHAWKEDDSSLQLYEEDGDGPEEANALIEADGRKWYTDYL